MKGKFEWLSWNTGGGCIVHYLVSETPYTIGVNDECVCILNNTVKANEMPEEDDYLFAYYFTENSPSRICEKLRVYFPGCADLSLWKSIVHMSEL